MGVNPEDTVRQLSGAPEVQPAAPLTLSQGGLRAQQLIDSRVTTLHADVAARAAQRFEELHPLPDHKVTEAIKNCILCLTYLSQDNALTKNPVAIEVSLATLPSDNRGPSSAPKLPRRIQKNLQLGATLAVRSQEIGILLEGLALVAEHPGIDKVTKGASKVLAEVRNLIKSGTVSGARDAQTKLDKSIQILTSTVAGLRGILDDTKPERRQALRKSYIDQTVDEEDANYRSSLEHKALKLLSLVQERHEQGDNRPALLRMARKLKSVGCDEVQQTLRDLTPTLLLEEGDLNEIQEIFDAANAPESAKEDPSEPVEQGPTKRSLKQNAVARKTLHVKTSRSTEATDTYMAQPAPEDAETIAYKDHLLAELGVNNPDLRASISNELSLEGVENICAAFSVLPEGVARAILAVNPHLVSPRSGENLLTFTSDLQEFLRGAYDLDEYPIFNPIASPHNFANHSRLKRTKGTATALRRASRNVEPQGPDVE